MDFSASEIFVTADDNIGQYHSEQTVDFLLSERHLLYRHPQTCMQPLYRCMLMQFLQFARTLGATYVDNYVLIIEGVHLYMLLHLCCNIKCTSSMEQGDDFGPLQTQHSCKTRLTAKSTVTMFMLHVTGTGFCTILMIVANVI